MGLILGPTPAARTGPAASIPAAETAGPTDPKDPTVLTLLSLKLLLLAFFILLTSLAEFQEDRTRQVLESVSRPSTARFRLIGATISVPRRSPTSRSWRPCSARWAISFNPACPP